MEGEKKSVDEKKSRFALFTKTFYDETPNLCDVTQMTLNREYE